MARVSISANVGRTVRTPARSSNFGRDKSAVLRPPRLKPIKTRDYAKASTASDPMQFGNVGFGQTGLTGES